MNHLFLFTITPVQDFISQSRKLLDLYGSSSILSCMSEIGVIVCDRKKGKIIFPHYNKEKNTDSYPNRFLVEFEDKSLDDIKEIAKEIEKSLLKFLKELNNKNHQKIYEHTENYFSFYWAISEIENNNYKDAFDKVEKRLAGAKNTRFFTQLGDGEGERGRKCSICGERNVVVAGKKLYKKLRLKRDDKLLSPNEGLCGVCYIKRDYGKKLKRGFESTANIALMNIFNKQNLDKKSYPLLKKDPQLFFEENLTDTYFKKYGYKNLSKYKNEYLKFQNDLKQYNLKQTSYYAVIMFDGDNMGKWLSGEEYIKEENKLQDFHKFLSQKLLNFANEVKKIDNLVTVYAGGEDFLGFVNINYLFEILQLLRDRWNEIVNKPLKKEFDLNKENFTFSAGVVIAHYKTPLSEVLKSVRGAEKKAKEAGRDRICFRVLKRSGEIREGILEYKKLLYLKEIKDEIIKHDISDSFISYLEKEFLIMCEENGELRLSRRSSMLKAEIIRLLQRRKSANQKFDEKLLSEKMLKLTSNNFRIFIDLLYIVKFLKREVYVNSH